MKIPFGWASAGVVAGAYLEKQRLTTVVFLSKANGSLPKPLILSSPESGQFFAFQLWMLLGNRFLLRNFPRGNKFFFAIRVCIRTFLEYCPEAIRLNLFLAAP